MFQRSNLPLCLAALSLTVLLACASRATAAKLNEVFGIVRDEQGIAFIVHEGVRFNVYEDPEQRKAWFQNTDTGDSSWTDPRTGADPITAQSLNDVAPPEVKSSSKITVYLVAILPVLLLAGGLMGRIYYLHTHYPELLWPTKERKYRARSSGGKHKAQKQRGKMNQDGKGGRSANS